MKSLEERKLLPAPGPGCNVISELSLRYSTSNALWVSPPPTHPPTAWSDRGCSLHSGWWCGRLRLYWQLPMSIRHYGMKQCFTQYLNLIFRVSPRPRRPGMLQGRPKSAETKWIWWTGCPPPIPRLPFSSLHFKGEIKGDNIYKVTGEDVTMGMTEEVWQTSVLPALHRVFCINSRQIQTPPPLYFLFVFNMQSTTPAIVHTHTLRRKNKMARRAQAPLRRNHHLLQAISWRVKKATWQRFSPSFFLSWWDWKLTFICCTLLKQLSPLPPTQPKKIKIKLSIYIPKPPAVSPALTTRLIAQLQSICTGRFKPHYVRFKITRVFFFYSAATLSLWNVEGGDRQLRLVFRLAHRQQYNFL